MRTSPYSGAIAGGEIPCAHARRAIMGGWPAPAFRTGVASASAAGEASAPACLRAPTPPLTSTRCRRTPLSVRPARTCTAVVPPVHTGSPTCLPSARGASGPCPWSLAETHLLQLPSAPRKRSSTAATAGVCHSTPTRSATRPSLTVVPAGPSCPSQRFSSTGRGGPASVARTPPGRTIPPATAPAVLASRDLRVSRRALIIVYDTTRPGQVASQLMRIHSAVGKSPALRLV